MYFNFQHFILNLFQLSRKIQQQQEVVISLTSTYITFICTFYAHCYIFWFHYYIFWFHYLSKILFTPNPIRTTLWRKNKFIFNHNKQYLIINFCSLWLSIFLHLYEMGFSCFCVCFLAVIRWTTSHGFVSCRLSLTLWIRVTHHNVFKDFGHLHTSSLCMYLTDKYSRFSRTSKIDFSGEMFKAFASALLENLK